ncbi:MULTISPECIES: hypothetical protein [Amycolatopsis]|uniref:Uncharacterized protein n=1 Tax=Amycolatopsis bullii TaxID=941987 RepID=A0ABQ3KC38_9PSEU|nr:hypothetical protein [Amycolatopsis bullii]GHG08853.1 hypothetical protein GCM10017567_27070 [Amycolatopsis bullii]
MTAAIYIDPLVIQPVIDGEWHRVRLTEIPTPGQVITMLCGAFGAAEFHLSDERRRHQIPRQCESCDVIDRRQRGIPLRGDRTGRR